MPFLDPSAVARVLAPRTVVADEDLGGTWAPVVRGVLDDGTTVIVKERRRSGVGWGYDPANLRNERAVLELLGQVEGGRAIGPCFVAGDDENGVVVMSDLGPGPVVERLLLDPAAATGAADGLVELGRVLGRLHAATASAAVHRSFLARRTALDERYDPARVRGRYVIHDLAALWADVAGFASESGFTPPGGLEDELARLFEELARPGPFLALTHLDASPHNCVLVPGGARLVDFEGAGLRHLGLDIAFLRFPFPNYGRWSVLPESVRIAMEDAYRATLVAEGLTAAEDDTAYDRAVAVGCAATVVLRIHRLPKIADDRDPGEAVRRRTQMVSAIDVFVDACARARMYPRLAGWFSGLGDEMRARWPECASPPRQFPALVAAGSG